MSKNKNLQDPFLNILRKQKVPVGIYLMSGIKLQGFIHAFDNFIIVLKNDLKKESLTQIIYKHAISTISPGQTIELNFEEMEENESESV